MALPWLVGTAGGLVAGDLWSEFKKYIAEDAAGKKEILRSMELLKRNNIGMSQAGFEVFASGLKGATGKSHSNVLNTMNAMASTGAVAGKSYQQATALAFDIGASKGIDSDKMASTLGRALKDPLKGLEVLKESNITLSIKDQEQIAQLVKSGKALEAQKTMIWALQSQFDGAATKQTRQYNDQFDSKYLSVENLRQHYDVGSDWNHGIKADKSTTPEEALDWVNNALAKYERDRNQGFHKGDTKGTEDILKRYRADLERMLAGSHEVRVREANKQIEQTMNASMHQIAEEKTINPQQNVESADVDTAACPFAGKNIEDICFKCECDCSDKKEVIEEQPKDEGGKYQEEKSSTPLPQTQLVSNTRGPGIAGSVPTILPTEGQGQLPFMGLTDLFTGEIETWTNKFDFLNTSVSKMFGGWQNDLLSVFNQGNFSIETFANKLLNLSANNPLQGFFGQLQGYMSSLSSMSFGGGGGGGFWGGLMNIASSAIGAYFGYSAPVSSSSSSSGSLSNVPDDYTDSLDGLTITASNRHNGGFVDGTGAISVVPASLFANAPRYHSGGAIGPGERPIIAKDGELVLNAAQQKNVAGRMNGGVNVTVPVIVENHSKEKVQSQEETGPDGKKQIRMLIGDAVKKGIASGQFDQSMNRAYGLSRKGY